MDGAGNVTAELVGSLAANIDDDETRFAHPPLQCVRIDE
jgi:hypothetical protein